MPSHLSSIPSSISCPAPVFCIATKALWTRERFSTKTKSRADPCLDSPPSLHLTSSLFCVLSGWGGRGGTASSAQLSTQKHKAAIFRCQAQICDLNPRGGGFTAAGVCSQRTALMFGPTTQPVGSGPPPPLSTVTTRYPRLWLGCCVHICVVLLLMSLC